LQKCHESLKKKRAGLWLLATAGALLAACGETGGGGNTGGGGAGGNSGEGQDAEISLTDVGTGGNVTPRPDAAVGGQPVPGGTVTDAAITTDATAPVGGAVADAQAPTPDVAVVANTCGGHEVIDLNAHLAANEAYEGTTAGVEGALAASCGGAAGGEVVFSYRVDRPLNHLTVRTDFPETQAPTVVYVRVDCEDPVDLVCNRGTVEAPGTRAVLDGVNPGLYYITVDTGSRDGGGAFRLSVEEDGASACRDLEDNDGDGLVDLTDPGCETPDDDIELDPPTPPACADGLDNDNNGLTDYPNDAQCDAAGDPREGPVCALDVPTTDVGVDGGLFSVPLPLAGNDLAQGRCYFEPVPEHLFILTLDRPSTVTVTNRSLNQLGIPVTLFARTDCADANAEIACVAPWQGSLPMGELQAGTYFVFAEISQQGGFDGGPVPFGGVQNVDIEFVVRPANPVCSDGVDNDRDGIIDLADPGCRNARDQDEADEAGVPYCANGVDDDGDGAIDFPGDEGCTGAGDACEEVGFDLCGGVCQDVLSNGRNCGTCGNVCADGVECIDGFCGGVYLFSGYQVNLPVDALAGWEQCFIDTYGDNTPTAGMRAACDGDLVLMGCRQAGSDVIQLAAMGESGEVFADTGDGPDATHEHNGVNWYYSENSSIGFVPAGAVASRNSCDTNAMDGNDDGTGEGRMCWHTSGASLNTGYRCGLNVTFGPEYERVIFTSRVGVPVRACGDGLDNDMDGRIDGDDPECSGPLDDQEAATPTACTDGIDNDLNGALDLDDPGCRSPWDSAEDAGDAIAVCSNGGDDDEDGNTDFGSDPDCRGAGGGSEEPRCGADVDVIEVGQNGGAWEIQPADGIDGQAGSCGDGSRRAQVFALTLTDPSAVQIRIEANGLPVGTPIYIRRACDDAESEIACRFEQQRPGVWRAGDFDRGLYYVFVEQGPHRTPWTVAIDVASNIRQCNDEVDNDRDNLIDAADPGCRRAFDDTEADEPGPRPECIDGIDNDEDGLTDWPDDADCVAAGDTYERLLCQGPYDVIDLPAQNGIYPIAFAPNPGPNRASCGDGPRGEVVYLLHLDDPSFVQIGARTGEIFGNGTYGTTSIRSVCDDVNTELACAGDQSNGQDARVARLEAGDYFVFVEDSFNWDPADPNLQPELQVVVRSLLQACENRRDDDGDGLVDADDLGCAAPSDNDETDDPNQRNYCADEADNDGDGNVDFPADDGCLAAGDPCEEVDFIQCDGVCLDGNTDANNCGSCGTVCDAGVECIDGYCGGAVPIFPNDAFGHHGGCENWNQCNDAQGCANAACASQGLGPAVEWEEGSCQQLPDQGILCNLFFDLGSGFDYDPDYRGCELPVAYHIVCSPGPN
jgi:hypothetical protein